MNHLVELVNSFSSPMFWLLVLIQITIAIAIGIAFVKWLKPQARIAHRVLLMSLVMIFIVPVTALAFQQWNIGLIPLAAEKTEALATGPARSDLSDRKAENASAADPLVDDDAIFLGHTDVDVPLVSSQVPSQITQKQSSNSPIAAATPQSVENKKAGGTTSSFSWFWLLLLGLAVVATVSIVQFAVSILQSFATLKKTKLLRDPMLQRHLDRAKKSLGITEEIVLAESRRTTVPIIWLWGKPQIILPTRRGELGEVDWYTVFLHELSHLVRKDHISAALASIVRALLPWHPLVRIAHRLFVESGEKACDQIVLEHVDSPREYANTLVAFQIYQQSAGSGVLFSPMAVERKRLRDRIHHILLNEHPTSSKFKIALTTICVVCMLAACTFARPYIAAPENRSQEKTTVEQANNNSLTPKQKQLIQQLRDKEAKIKIDAKTQLIDIEFPGGNEVRTPKSDGRTVHTLDRLWQHDLKLLRRLNELPIRHVGITNARFSKEEFREICQLADLQSLAISVQPKIPRESYADIANLKNLKSLTVSSDKIDSKLVTRFANLKKLESIRLYGVNISPDAIRALAKTATLRHLDFSFVEYDQETLDEIFKLKQLTSLRLGAFQRAVNNRKLIATFPIDITGVAQLKNLVSFQVHLNSLSDESWQAIGQLRGLRYFGIWGVKFTSSQFKHCIPALRPTSKNKSLTLFGFSNDSVNDTVIDLLVNDRKFCENKLTMPVTLSFRVKPESALRFKRAFPETLVSHQQLVKDDQGYRIASRAVELPEEIKKHVSQTVKLKHAEPAEILPKLQKMYDEDFQHFLGRVKISLRLKDKSLEITGSVKAVSAVKSLIQNMDVAHAIKIKQEQEDPKDPRTWGDESWKNKLLRPTDQQWRVGWTLGNQLNLLSGDRDYKVLKDNWTDIAPQVKRQILKTYNPWWGKDRKRKIADRLFDILWLGLNDRNEEVQETAKFYANNITFSKLADKKLDYANFLKKHKGKTATQILKLLTKSFVESMEKAKKDNVDQLLETLDRNRSNIRNSEVLINTFKQSEIQAIFDRWIKNDWMDESDRRYTNFASMVTKVGAKFPEPAKLKNEEFTVGGDKQKKYFLIGRFDKQKTPDEGFKLLLILPGGTGSADFNPFCQRIHADQAPSNYLSVQLVAPVWNGKQDVVWPTNQSNPEKARFTTEQFITDVVNDVAKKVKINRKYILAMGWSSGGPPIYSASMTKNCPVTGTMPVMSAFRDKWIPDIAGAKNHPYFILHSPDDWIKIDEHARVAEKKLKAAGAIVQFDTYRGGHGWRGNSVGKISSGLTWLDKTITANHKKKEKEQKK